MFLFSFYLIIFSFEKHIQYNITKETTKTYRQKLNDDIFIQIPLTNLAFIVHSTSSLLMSVNVDSLNPNFGPHNEDFPKRNKEHLGFLGQETRSFGVYFGNNTGSIYIRCQNDTTFSFSAIFIPPECDIVHTSLASDDVFTFVSPELLQSINKNEVNETLDPNTTICFWHSTPSKSETLINFNEIDDSSDISLDYISKTVNYQYNIETADCEDDKPPSVNPTPPPKPTLKPKPYPTKSPKPTKEPDPTEEPNHTELPRPTKDPYTPTEIPDRTKFVFPTRPVPPWDHQPLYPEDPDDPFEYYDLDHPIYDSNSQLSSNQNTDPNKNDDSYHNDLNQNNDLIGNNDSNNKDNSNQADGSYHNNDSNQNDASNTNEHSIGTDENLDGRFNFYSKYKTQNVLPTTNKFRPHHRIECSDFFHQGWEENKGDDQDKPEDESDSDEDDKHKREVLGKRKHKRRSSRRSKNKRSRKVHKILSEDNKPNMSSSIHDSHIGNSFTAIRIGSIIGSNASIVFKFAKGKNQSSSFDSVPFHSIIRPQSMPSFLVDEKFFPLKPGGMWPHPRPDFRPDDEFDCINSFNCKDNGPMNDMNKGLRKEMEIVSYVLFAICSICTIIIIACMIFIHMKNKAKKARIRNIESIEQERQDIETGIKKLPHIPQATNHLPLNSLFNPFVHQDETKNPLNEEDQIVHDQIDDFSDVSV